MLVVSVWDSQTELIISLFILIFKIISTYDSSTLSWSHTLVIWAAPDSKLVGLVIPCSTKYFRCLFRISSICRNVETKGKVFWK